MVSTKTYIHIANGIMLEGIGFGSNKKAIGELVFTTSMTGYPESLTDPSYKGQILVFTHPLVGNYGVPKKIIRKGMNLIKNFESDHIQAEGVVASEFTNRKRWDSELNFDSWLKTNGTTGIHGIDTRMLTIMLRDGGSRIGMISSQEKDKRLLSKYDYESINFVEMVSPKKPIMHKNNGKKSKGVIVIVDFGAKNGFINDIIDMGYSVVRVPWDYSYSQIMAFNPSGLVYSNGPGNPNLLKKPIENIAQLLDSGVPSLGICLGHQLTAIALGGKIKKMRFGHRAVNRGVINMLDGRTYITTHNHGYALLKEGMPKSSSVLFESIDDHVVEGFIDRKHNLMTTQFHPDARPGAFDTKFVFGMFDKMVKNGKR